MAPKSSPASMLECPDLQGACMAVGPPYSPR